MFNDGQSEGGYMLGRITAFCYGVACYALSLASFVYAFCFLGNFGLAKSIDSGTQSPFLRALAINVGLLGIFAVQHSVMARPWFKAAWTRIVPTPVERSTYLLFSCAALFLVFWKWQPMGGVIWNLGSTSTAGLALDVLYTAGWLIVLAATFLINHFDLFGLRQIWLNLRGRAYTSLKFRTPGLYRYVRHPLYVGWLLVFWSAPVMTSAHLVFAVATTAYIFIAIQFEERDLVRFHKEYVEYRRRVPMILPVGSSKRGESAAVQPARAEQAS
jgi:methanethiol S-methyltransferase